MVLLAKTKSARAYSPVHVSDWQSLLDMFESIGQIRIRKNVFKFSFLCCMEHQRCEETIQPPSGEGLQPFLQSMQDSKWAASPGTAVSVPKLQWFCCTVTCFQYRQEQSFPLRILEGHRGFWRWTVVDFTLIIGSELFTNYVTVLSSIWDAQKSYQYQSSKWVMVDYHRASLTECVCPVLFL